MNSRYIKIVAVITMTFDHVGYMLFPEVDTLRIIGRIAMPLFCLLIAYGVTKTRNPFKYFLRLFGFAVAVQLFFNLYIEHNLFAFYNWNVFFTLSLGVAAASLVKIAITLCTGQDKLSFKRFILITGIILGACAIAIFADILPLEYNYGSAGVLLVVLFYMALRHSVAALKVTSAGSLAVFNILLFFLMDGWWIQWFAFLALPFILLFVDRKLKISAAEKYAFYIYYPLHFAVIYLIGTI